MADTTTPPVDVRYTAGDPADIGAPQIPETLSGSAAELYNAAAQKHGAYNVTVAEHADAVAEIVAANLGTVHWNGGDWKPGEGSLWVQRLHPLYFVADGSGDTTIEIRTGDPHRGTDRLLGVLAGAALTKTNDGRRHHLTSRHRTVTDGEHDATHLVNAELDLVTFDDVDRRGRTHLRAVITELAAWPLGAELADPRDDRGITECTYCAENHDNAHPIGAYLPPERPELKALHGTVVTLVVTRRS